jgi:hypothetical protein
MGGLLARSQSIRRDGDTSRPLHANVLAGLGPDVEECSLEEASALLKRMPDLSKELRKAPATLKRQVFEAFDLKVVYDKIEGRIEISATVSEAIAEAFDNAKDLPEEVHRVAQKDIAGAGFEPATFGL